MSHSAHAHPREANMGSNAEKLPPIPACAALGAAASPPPPAFTAVAPLSAPAHPGGAAAADPGASGGDRSETSGVALVDAEHEVKLESANAAAKPNVPAAEGSAAAPSHTAADAAAPCSALSALHVAPRVLEQKHKPDHACFLSLLAPVELQSVMQFLALPSLLAFARCSRRTLRDASSDFAWKHQPLFQLHLGAGLEDVSERMCGSLLRHLPAIAVSYEQEWSRPSASSEEIAALLRIPRIRQLRVERQGITGEKWRAILTAPQLAELRQLNVETATTSLPPGFTSLLAAHMPHVSHLTLGKIFAAGEEFEGLSALAHLTALDLHCGRLSEEQSAAAFAAIAACPRLIDLTLQCAQLQGARFRQLFCSPAFARLHRLTLDNIGGHDTSAEDLAAGFANLQQLQDLSLLVAESHLAHWPPHLHHAPQLRRLHIQPAYSLYLRSLATFQRLLDAKPQLHIQLDDRYCADFKGMSAEQWQSLGFSAPRFTLFRA